MSTMATPPLEQTAARAEPAALAQIRESTQALFAEGRPDEALDYSLAALAAVLRRNTELERLVTLLRRARLGTRSERISPEQMALLLEELKQLGGAEAEADPIAEAREDEALSQELESARAAADAQTERHPSRKRWHTREVEQRVHHLEIAPEERTCPECGREKRRIGEDITHRLEFVPAHFIEHEYHREKYACSSCKRGVSTAEAPPAVIERSVADASVLAHVVVSKYVDHTPLQRLHRIYARSGVEIAVSTLADWVARVADRVTPLVDVLAARLLNAHLVGTDATGLKVLDPGSPDHIERGTLWCYVGDERDVVFRYTPTGEGESGPWTFLAGRHGYIQADAASVFDRLYNGRAAFAVEVGCWAHARRKYVELQTTDCRVAYPLQLIGRLFRIERLADTQQLDAEARRVLRTERSSLVLGKLKRWLIATVEKEPPGSALAKAASYNLNHWDALTRFLDDGRLRLDNNLCEQQLRDVALGRKNFLFAGSHDAARRTAVLYSLMRTCAQHGVVPLPYLTDVLGKLTGWDPSRLEDLLPDRWLQLYSSAPDLPQPHALIDPLN